MLEEIPEPLPEEEVPEPDPDAPVKCSRCRVAVPYRNVAEHECDEGIVHEVRFASIVGCDDFPRLRAILKRANGELTMAVNLFFDEPN